MLRSTADAYLRPRARHGASRAVDRALADAPTPDLGGTATTRQFGDAVLAAL